MLKVEKWSDRARVLNGDCIDVMRQLPDASVDSIVTDPPYGVNFMGRAWDKGVPSVEVWREALRVLKPGGHLLAFGGTRTCHRLTCAVEDAGFEIRDLIPWIYGKGFPKSHNIHKAIEKAALAAPATPEAQQWDGWGTALKPAFEPITVARKPIAKGSTVARNVLEYGTGAINVDGCRVGDETHKIPGRRSGFGGVTEGASYGGTQGGYNYGPSPEKIVQGRWPANLIHDNSDEVQDILGHASRFFYSAKASKADRNDGLEAAQARPSAASEFRPNHAEKAAAGADGNPYGRWKPEKNFHPTVKPTDLMRYLCRLVTPPGGVVLDPFMGSGSTGRGALMEGFRFIGCDLDAEYVEISRARIRAAHLAA